MELAWMADTKTRCMGAVPPHVLSSKGKEGGETPEQPKRTGKKAAFAEDDDSPRKVGAEVLRGRCIYITMAQIDGQNPVITAIPGHNHMSTCQVPSGCNMADLRIHNSWACTRKAALPRYTPTIAAHALDCMKNDMVYTSFADGCTSPSANMSAQVDPTCSHHNSQLDNLSP